MATKYLSKAGNASDANDGSIGSPWRTNAKARSFLSSTALPGDAVLAHTGYDYEGSVHITRYR
jgi:hypothetical protein